MNFVRTLDEEELTSDDPKHAALMKGPYQNKISQSLGKSKLAQLLTKNEGLPEDPFFDKINNLLAEFPKETKLKSAASK